MPKAVIFDVDGTLIASVDAHAQAWVDAFAYFGFPAEFADVRADVGKGGDQLMPGFVPPDVVEARSEEIETFRTKLFAREHLPKVQAFPGVRDLFERIRADGLRIVLASSAKGEELERYLEITGIGDLIEGATSSDDAERSKPFPDIFLAALKTLPGVEESEAVVVGDTPYDAEAARAAGMDCIGVLSGGFTTDSLNAVGCSAVYADVAELLQEYDASPLSAR
jgi:HAD superfamily hydrolase (TIGR01509 family)